MQTFNSIDQSNHSINRLKQTTTELLALVTQFDDTTFNEVPFEGSWTAAQVADHIRKSVKGIPSVLTGTGIPADRSPDEKFELIAGESTLGGGAGPTSNVQTTLIAITHPARSAQDIEHQLRTSTPPIISRISEGKVLLDLRTVFPDQLPALHEALKSL